MQKSSPLSGVDSARYAHAAVTRNGTKRAATNEHVFGTEATAAKDATIEDLPACALENQRSVLRPPVHLNMLRNLAWNHGVWVV